VTAVSVSADHTSVTYTIAGLTEGSVSVSLPAGVLNDSFGNPMPTSYSAAYGVDIGTVSFPTPMLAANPVGSEVYQGSVTGLFNSQVPPFIYAGSGGLNEPVGAVYGPDGNLYVASFGSNSILRYNPMTGAFLSTFVSSGSGGLTSPTGLFFGSDGKLYVVSQGNNSVLRYNGTTGAFLDTFVTSGSGGLSQAQRAAFGTDGDLYVSSGNTNSILRYNGSTGAFLNAFVSAGSGGLSSPDRVRFRARWQALRQ
jgi:DNA-binding beta-propeller fold protein YncE